MKKNDRVKTSDDSDMRETGGPFIPNGTEGTVLKVRRGINKGYIRVAFDNFAPYDCKVNSIERI